MFHDCWCSESGSIKFTECSHKVIWTHPNFHLHHYSRSCHKTVQLCDRWVKCLLSVWLIRTSWLVKEGLNAAFLICWEMPRWSDCGSINTPPRYLLDNFPAGPGLFPCRTWTSQMSVILPQLSEAIMTICSALFLVIRSMFSHETLDPSNQSLLSRACGPCLNQNFMSSTAAAVWRLKLSNDRRERGVNILKRQMHLCHLRHFTHCSFTCVYPHPPHPLTGGPPVAGTAPLNLQFSTSQRHAQRSLSWRQTPNESAGLDWLSLCSLSPPPVIKLCWLNFRQGTESTFTAHIYSKEEAPLLLAWFKPCSLIKLFKMCSWYYNTHFHFECDGTFRWKWKPMIKLASNHNSNILS